MAKHKDLEHSEELFQSLQRITAVTPLISPHEWQTSPVGELRKMKKFRFQLLHRWLTNRFAPCRMADIAGGKGLLTYLLQQSGWEGTVIDPHHQLLPDKYKDIVTGIQTKISPLATVPHISKPFFREMAASFDLLVGLHAHGCNYAIVDAAAEFGCGFVLLPCCVIDEPFLPSPGAHWLESLAEYALSQNQLVTPFQLNFKGQNIGLVGGRSARN